MTDGPYPLAGTGDPLEPRMPASLGRLAPVDPRSVWADEARDFTPWLLANADALAEALGIELELHAAEHPVGAFSLDLMGRDTTNECVLIVENQLSQTDHGHLGQLLTYAAGTEARTIVWTAPKFREEHRQALDFLNRMTGEDCRFFGVEIAVVRIGDSPAAPLFRLRAQPNDWSAQVSSATKETVNQSGKAALYADFWDKFLDRLHAECPGFTRSRKRGGNNWITLVTIRGLQYVVDFVSAGRIRSELYIDTGDADQNVAIHDALQAERTAIEAEFGGRLEWEGLLGKRACRVGIYAPGDVSNVVAHDEYISWFIDTITRLRQATEARATAALNATLGA